MTDAITSSSPTSQSGTRAGILIMVLGMVLFSLNDALGKWLVSSYSVPQLMLIRSVAALAVLLPFFWRTGWRSLMRVERSWLQVLRSALFAFDAIAFYFAVGYMPLADTMTYWLATPIYVAAFSPLMLSEKIGWRRWTAILVGFAGVVIALEPSSDRITMPALIAFCGSIAFALAMVLGRTLRGTPDTTLVFWQVAGAGLFSVVGVAFDPSGWAPVSPVDFGLLSLLGIVAMGAHILVNRSLKLADASTVVPLQYTSLIWAVLFGWIFFGDLPRTAMLVGAGFIVASGLFIFFREQTLKRGARR